MERICEEEVHEPELLEINEYQYSITNNEIAMDHGGEVGNGHNIESLSSMMES